jgi:hypothetical protein
MIAIWAAMVARAAPGHASSVQAASATSVVGRRRRHGLTLDNIVVMVPYFPCVRKDAG